MENLFIKLLNMSISAGWFVLAVILFRAVFKKIPKWANVTMWALVGIRLVCPVSLKSMFSLIPSSETVPEGILYAQNPEIHSGIPALNSVVNPVISDSLAPDMANSVNPMQVIMIIAANIWVLGVASMLIYTAVSYFLVKRKVREAVILENGIWLSDGVGTPFILGIIKPKIYLPMSLSEDDAQYVIAHERAHLKRGDHLIKPFAFLLLSIYWFNPLMWAAYILLCRDIELACDEKVVKNMGSEIKKPYSEALVNCSSPSKRIAACPLAFGEVGVKTRIKNVLRYKKPALAIVILSVLICTVLALCFLTDPIDKWGKDSDDVNVSIIGGADGPTDILVSKKLTLEKLIKLSEKGEKLTRSDFKGFYHYETGSGLYIECYPIDERFSLYIGYLNQDTEEVFYMYLSANTTENGSIDIRYGGVEEFIEQHRNLPIVTHVSASWHLCPVGEREDVYAEFIKLYGIPRDAAVNSIRTLPTARIDSKGDLDNFIENMKGYMNFNLSFPDKDNFVTNSFYDTKEIFNEEFFAENTLFLMYICSSAEERYTAHSITKCEGILGISLSETVYGSMNTGAFGWLMCVSVPKADLADIERTDARIIKIIDGDDKVSDVTAAYVYTDSSDDLSKPSVMLHRNGEFNMNFSVLSSYSGFGYYTVHGDLLILCTDDGQYTYVFRIEESSIVFDAKASSKTLHMAEIPDGAVFELALPHEPTIEE